MDTNQVRKIVGSKIFSVVFTKKDGTINLNTLSQIKCGKIYTL